jgi:hypothetical protein
MAVFEQFVDGTNWKPSRQNEPPFGGFPGNWWMAPIGKMVVQGDGGEGIGQCRILKYQTNG